MTSLLPIASVLALLLFGFAVGKALPPAYLRLMLKPISIVVLLLLFLMGSEFGSVFTDKSLGGDIIKRALLFQSCGGFFGRCGSLLFTAEGLVGRHA